MALLQIKWYRTLYLVFRIPLGRLEASHLYSTSLARRGDLVSLRLTLYSKTSYENKICIIVFLPSVRPSKRHPYDEILLRLHHLFFSYLTTIVCNHGVIFLDEVESKYLI